MRWLEDLVVFILGAAIVIVAVCFAGSVIMAMLSFIASLLGIILSYILPFAVMIGVFYLVERILR